MAKLPVLPVYTDAYLGDTMHLSLEEHGAYLKLLMIIWRNNGPIPDDDQRIARMLGITTQRWKEKLKPTISTFFDLSSGTWLQKRLENERKKISNYSSSMAQNGMKGGRPKSLKSNGHDKAAGSLRPKPQETNPYPYKKEEEESPNGDSSPSESPNGDSCPSPDAEFEEAYRLYPRHVGRGQAMRAYRSARKIATHGEIMAGIRRMAVESRTTDPKFIPHLATWLNGQRWLDEEAKANGPEARLRFGSPGLS